MYVTTTQETFLVGMEQLSFKKKINIPRVLLCLLGEPELDRLAGLRLELVFTLLDGLLALRLVSDELHWPLLARTSAPVACCRAAGNVLVRFTLFIGIWVEVWPPRKKEKRKIIIKLVIFLGRCTPSSLNSR